MHTTDSTIIYEYGQGRTGSHVFIISKSSEHLKEDAGKMLRWYFQRGRNELRFYLLKLKTWGSFSRTKISEHPDTKKKNSN